ncbi:hypothetical protein BS47DRAFT_1336353 [Hydnum rufescens UP504]|uniref:Uncharacterized protein n=1 Tax=Hydnum rufescens UP504 TaxID=1448309 RepID=A0A9P6B9L1_9AGAM|nr:hypothetical protein BS47DRAFT_1336353 [Hydnum rufescens UP504]
MVRSRSKRCNKQDIWTLGRPPSESQKRFGTRIEFGPASLQGKMEAGHATTNELTFIQAFPGFPRFYLSRGMHDFTGTMNGRHRLH